MLTQIKTLKNGFSLPVLGIGTWTLGGKRQKDTSSDTINIESLQRGIENGITHFDTAEGYADGHAEELLGITIQQYQRSTLFLTSKVSPNHLTYDSVISSCENSLKRLQTTYLDLYLIHSPNSLIPVNETMKAMDYLKAKKLIRNIGVSNFSVEQLQEAQLCTNNKIVANQLHYNLMYREIEQKGVLSYCQENNIMIIAYRPLQKGLLSKEGIVVVDGLCKKYAKTPSQIALNWLIAQKNVVVITKMVEKSHLIDNLGSIGWQMEQKEVDFLTRNYPKQISISDVYPLT